jgi:hypothetical protein
MSKDVQNPEYYSIAVLEGGAIAGDENWHGRIANTCH